MDPNWWPIGDLFGAVGAIAGSRGQLNHDNYDEPTQEPWYKGALTWAQFVVAILGLLVPLLILAIGDRIALSKEIIKIKEEHVQDVNDLKNTLAIFNERQTNVRLKLEGLTQLDKEIQQLRLDMERHRSSTEKTYFRGQQIP